MDFFFKALAMAHSTPQGRVPEPILYLNKSLVVHLISCALVQFGINLTSCQSPSHVLLWVSSL
jgi:hypothetical protein